MKTFNDLDAFFVCFLFGKGLNKPVIRIAGEYFKIPKNVINEAVAIAKADGDLEALRNACNAYRLVVQDDV